MFVFWFCLVCVRFVISEKVTFIFMYRGGDGYVFIGGI